MRGGRPAGTLELRRFLSPARVELGPIMRYSLQGLRLFPQRDPMAAMRRLATTSESRYQDGEGVAADLGKAAALYQRACDANEGDACESLGDMYWYGIGFKEDQVKGKALLKKGCDLGSRWACQRLQFINQFEK